jgi:RecB family exonuclease
MLTFDPVEHKYSYAGTRMPSVTQILDAAGFIDKRWFTEEARDRGTAVHKIVEAYIKYDDDACDVLLEGYLDAYKKAKREIGFEVIESEILVHSIRYWYAGTLDLIAVVDGELAVIDIKSGSDVPAYALQTAAYAEAYFEQNAMPITKRYGLYLAQDGTYKFPEHREKEGEVPHIEVFRAAALTTNWKLQNLK